MLSYLDTAVMAYLAPPEMGGKQYQDGENFQPSYQHCYRANPGLEIVQPGIIAGGSDLAESGTTIVYRCQYGG